MDSEHAEGILRDVAARSSYPYTTTGPAATRVLAELDAARTEIERLRALVAPPVDPLQVVGLGQARELIRSLDAELDAARARIAELEGELATAESTSKGDRDDRRS